MAATAKKERTPEQIAADKARMAAIRAKKGTKPKPVLEAASVAKAFVEHKRAASIPDEFAGLTVATCCDGCKPGACVISGDEWCVHPRNSFLQTFHQTKPEVVARYTRAKKMLSEA